MKALCPICRKPADAAYRPFCSRRCSDVDLQRWFAGRYVLSGETEDEPDDDASSEGEAEE